MVQRCEAGGSGGLAPPQPLAATMPGVQGAEPPGKNRDLPVLFIRFHLAESAQKFGTIVEDPFADLENP